MMNKDFVFAYIICTTSSLVAANVTALCAGWYYIVVVVVVVVVVKIAINQRHNSREGGKYWTLQLSRFGRLKLIMQTRAETRNILLLTPHMSSGMCQ